MIEFYYPAEIDLETVSYFAIALSCFLLECKRLQMLQLSWMQILFPAIFGLGIIIFTFAFLMSAIPRLGTLERPDVPSERRSPPGLAGLDRLEPVAVAFRNVGVPKALDRIPRFNLAIAIQ